MKFHPLALENARVKLRQDLVFLPSEDGTLFRCRGEAFVFRGHEVYRLFLALVPHLTGDHTLGEIISQEQQFKNNGALRQLLQILSEKGLLIEYLDDGSQTNASILEAFSPQIGFIEHYATNAVSRFQKFRNSRLFLTGSGPPLHALAMALARNGIATVVSDNQSVVANPEFSSLIRELDSMGVSLDFNMMQLERVLRDEGDSVDAICYASDEMDFEKLVKINIFCLEKHVPFIPGFLLGGKAFVGPFVHTGYKACWMCFALRWSANVCPPLSSMFWKHIALNSCWEYDRQSAGSPSLQILGNTLAFEVFRFLAGHIPEETQQAALGIDLETLSMHKAVVLQHPMCPHCSSFEPECDRLFLLKQTSGTTVPKLSLRAKLKICSVLVDVTTGVFMSFRDDDLVQTPIFRSAVVMPHLSDGSRSEFCGYSLDSNAASRVDAIRNGIRSYAVANIDKRRFWKGSMRDAEAAGLDPVSSHVLTGWIGTGVGVRSEGTVFWTYALSMKKGTVQTLPAAAVYCESSLNSAEFDALNGGIGVGFSFEEACADAAASLFLQGALKQAAERGTRFTYIHLDPRRLSANTRDLRYLIKVLRTLNQAVRLFALRCPNGLVLTVALSLSLAVDSAQIAVGGGESLDDAATIALRHLTAIATGGASSSTLAHYLPPGLGYELTTSIVERAASVSAEDTLDPKTTDSPPQMLDLRFADILIANISSEDVASAGLFVVKAVGVYDPISHMSSKNEHNWCEC